MKPSIRTFLSLSMASICLLTNDVTARDENRKRNRFERENHQVFIENLGQIIDQYGNQRNDVLFYTSLSGVQVFITKTGISYQFFSVENNGESLEIEHQQIKKSLPNQGKSYRIDLEWINPSERLQVLKIGQKSGYTNFYNLPEKIGHVLFVKEYDKMLLKNVWEGIDLEFYFKNGILETDWIVSRAEDFKKIAYKIKGADITIEKGLLTLNTPFGKIVEGNITAEQNHKILRAEWKIEKDIVRIELFNYEKGQPLRIDPPTRVWASYYGADSREEVYAVTTDANNNVIFTGLTLSTQNIATTGAHQTTFSGLNNKWDAILVKFNKNGQRLWATYYGGNDFDHGRDVATDAQGNIYMVGATKSTNNIATPGAHQTTWSATLSAPYAGFVVKFNSDGVRQWGTFYAGSYPHEQLLACASTPDGFLYVGGYSLSQSGISTPNAHQPQNNGGGDALLAKFSPNGSLVWGTFYGGTSSETIEDLCIDKDGNVVVVGHTTSPTSIATPGTHRNTLGSPSPYEDAFISKFSPNGQLIWGTYFGGEVYDFAKCVATDHLGNIAVGGYTTSDTGIATPGAHQLTRTQGFANDNFVVKFTSQGQRIWGTYYGGPADEKPGGIAVDGLGNIYFTGWSSSETHIATPGSYQPAISVNPPYFPTNEGFIVRFSPNGVRLWGTYYGGLGTDEIHDCTFDKESNLIVVGITSTTHTQNPNTHYTPGAHQSTIGGDLDGFVAKFSVSSVGLEEYFGNKKLGIYPNPARTTITLTTPFTCKSTYKIFDINGRGILEGTLPDNQEIDVKSLKPGIYIIKIFSSAEEAFAKFVIAK